MTDAVTEPAGPILRLRGVGRRFGGLHAVRDVDLDVAPGERRAILGPNGAGKTTLFNLISGDIPQTSGTIEFQGMDVGEIPPAGRTRLGMGRTYQKSRLFLGLSVEDNLYLAVLGSRDGHLRMLREGGRRRDARARPRARPARRPGAPARRPRRQHLPRRAAPARGRHGPRDRADAHAARRAGLRALARRARRRSPTCCSSSTGASRSSSSSTTWTSPCAWQSTSR